MSEQLVFDFDKPLTKRCTKCGVEKDVTMFCKDRTKKDGLETACKLCRNEAKKLYRKKNTKQNENFEFPEGVKTCTKCGVEKPYTDFHIHRKEKSGVQACCKSCKYESFKQYHQQKPHMSRAKTQRRRAAKLKATPPWLTPWQKEMIKIMFETCPDGYHVDHIIPLKGKEISGWNVPWNLQHLPASENISKGTTWKQEDARHYYE